MSAEPMALVRAIRRMERAGFRLALENEGLAVTPASQLNEQQRAYLRAHKAALVALLTDAERLAHVLEQAGAAGLGWCEGMPTDWTPAYRLAVGEVLYADGRMVNRLGRCYSATVAPPMADTPDAPFVAEIESCAATMALSIDVEAYEERAAIMEYDGGLPRDEAEAKAKAIAVRSAELQAKGWEPWNAKARAESEVLLGLERAA